MWRAEHLHCISMMLLFSINYQITIKKIGGKILLFWTRCVLLTAELLKYFISNIHLISRQSELYCDKWSIRCAFKRV